MPRQYPYITRSLVVIASTFVAFAVSPKTIGSPERYTATAVNMNNGTAGNINTTVDRWSTDKARDALIAAFVKNGPRSFSTRCRTHGRSVILERLATSVGTSASRGECRFPTGASASCW